MSKESSLGDDSQSLHPVTGVPLSKGRRDRNVLESFKAALSLLNRRDRRLFGLASVISMSLGALDLLGVALFGMVGAVAVSGIDPNSLPPVVGKFLAYFGLGDLTASQLVGIFAGAATLLLLFKTLVSALLTRRMFKFLANRQADVAARLASTILSRQLLDVQKWSTAEVIYALTGGVSAAVTNLLGSALIIVTELFLFSIIVHTVVLQPFLKSSRS